MKKILNLATVFIAFITISFFASCGKGDQQGQLLTSGMSLDSRLSCDQSSVDWSTNERYYDLQLYSGYHIGRVTIRITHRVMNAYNADYTDVYEIPQDNILPGWNKLPNPALLGDIMDVTFVCSP